MSAWVMMMCHVEHSETSRQILVAQDSSPASRFRMTKVRDFCHCEQRERSNPQAKPSMIEILSRLIAILTLAMTIANFCKDISLSF